MMSLTAFLRVTAFFYFVSEYEIPTRPFSTRFYFRMINLPADVLLLIFSLLSQNDKLECMTVCRHWDRVLQHNLFQVIYIRSEDQLNHLIERVKKDPILGTKVEQLTIRSKFNANHDSTIFITLFPNVREFAIKNTEPTFDRSPFKPVPGHPWCKHITKIAETNSAVYTKTLLHHALCKNLTNIQLTGRGSVNSIIESLANAPALKTFFLHGYIVTFDDLELLHEMTPVLSLLSLEQVQFAVTPFPLDIKPATSVKSFQYVGRHGLDDFDIPNPHLIYASEKYTQLEELVIELDILVDREDDEDDDPYLLEEQRELLARYFKSLGLRLKSFILILDTFDFDCSTGFDFDLLDQCGCQIRKLGLANGVEEDKLEQLAKTTQVQYIESLIVLPLPDRRSMSFEWLLSFTVLTELVLYFPSYVPSAKREYYSMGLSDLFGCLSASPLKTLRLNRVDCEADDFGRLHTYPSLKNLILFQCRLEKGFDSCLSRGFPNLRSLTLDSCFENRDYFMLQHSNLSYLQIINKSVEVDSSILIITLADGQQRLYNTSKLPTFSSYPAISVEMTTSSSFYVSSKPFHKSDATPMLSIVCNSLYNFNMRIQA